MNVTETIQPTRIAPPLPPLIAPPSAPHQFMRPDQVPQMAKPAPSRQVEAKPMVLVPEGARVDYGGRAAYVGASIWYVHTEAGRLIPLPGMLFRRSKTQPDLWSLKSYYHEGDRGTMRANIPFCTAEEIKEGCWMWPVVPDVWPPRPTAVAPVTVTLGEQEVPELWSGDMPGLQIKGGIVANTLAATALNLSPEEQEAKAWAEQRAKKAEPPVVETDSDLAAMEELTRPESVSAP